MRNTLRGVGLVFYGFGIFLKNAFSFALMPWQTSRRWLGYEHSDKYAPALLYSILSILLIPLAVNFPMTLWTTLPVAGMNLLSGLYEIGRAYDPDGTANQVSSNSKTQEDGMNTVETKVDDKVQTYAEPRNAYEHEINGLKKAIDEDEGKIRFWKWLAIGTLSVVLLAGAITGYALHKGILTAQVDGVSLAEELDKAQAELERLKGEMPALEDAKKKFDEMMEKAKEMVPPGILPPNKDKGDDF